NNDGSNPQQQDILFGSTETEPSLHPLLDTQMLFVTTRTGDSDIWRRTVSAIDGSTININLTKSDLSNEHSPAWSPDAGFIVYISDDSGVDNLWQIDPTGDFPLQVSFFSRAVAD